MNSLRKVRLAVFGWVAVGLHLLRSGYQRITGRRVEEMANYTELKPGLFLGGQCANPPEGTRAVLSVTPNRDAFSAEFYQWRPVPTGAMPTVEWLREQVEFIDLHRKEKRGVFVHCDAGMDRSAMVVVAYLMWRDGMTRDAAIETVRRKRAIQVNPAFMEMLREWEGSMGCSSMSG
jgi:hypothetical protein